MSFLIRHRALKFEIMGDLGSRTDMSERLKLKIFFEQISSERIVDSGFQNLPMEKNCVHNCTYLVFTYGKSHDFF